MVNRIYPSSSDFDNLSRLRTEMSTGANTFDYSAVVVNKPWGYEYLWYQNTTVAIWMLHLLPNRATSLHCHVRKRTSLIVIDGQVVCSTLEDRRRLDVLQSVVLEPCVFHTTQAISDAGAFVMEVETPPLKGDLVRLKDTFGREGTGYEGTDVYSTDFSAYEYAPLTAERRSGNVNFRTLSMHVRTVSGRDALQTLLVRCGLIVPCDGRLAAGGGLIIEPGEAFPKNRLSLDTVDSKFPAVELLGIGMTNENQ